MLIPGPQAGFEKRSAREDVVGQRLWLTDAGECGTPCTGTARARAHRCLRRRTPCSGSAGARAHRCLSRRTPCKRCARARAHSATSCRRRCTVAIHPSETPSAQCWSRGTTNLSGTLRRTGMERGVGALCRQPRHRCFHLRASLRTARRSPRCPSLP
eukprot:COSAG03_NODE_1234_length_4497_cov_83.406810_3_plen_157_part_00